MPKPLPIAKLSIVQKDKPTVPGLHSDIAIAIMQKEGKAFGLAHAAGTIEDQERTADDLKIAIERAITTGFAYGAQQQQRNGHKVRT